MARITSYPVLSTVSSGDWIPITDTSVTGNPLKNVTVADLQSFIIQGSTLQTVITAGNTYQGPQGPLWEWSNRRLTATSSTNSASFSETSFQATSLIDNSYTAINPASLTMVIPSGRGTILIPNSSLVSNVTLQMPLASGVLALTTDIPASPWVPVIGGINYPGGRVGVNTPLPQEELDITGDVLVTGRLTVSAGMNGELDGTISSDTTGTTQASTDDSTKVATTAFVTNAVGAIPSGLAFQGNWNALMNFPDIGASPNIDNGDFYIVSVAGTTNLGGITDWEVGDWAIAVVSGGVTTWQKIDNSSVLTGQGTGTKIAKWDGTGTSVTLTDSAIEEIAGASGQSSIGINTVPDTDASIYNGYTTGDVDVTIGIKNKAYNTNTNAAINANVYGITSDATSNQTVGFAGNVYGIRSNARHEGASSVAFVVGSTAKATITNGGSPTSGNVYGNYALAEATGTNTSNSKYNIGNFVSSAIDNPNHTAVNFIGSYVSTTPKNGTAGDMVVLQVNNEDVGTGSFNLTGDLTYLKITQGIMGAIGGTARAIHSEVTLPSLLLGSLESTGFIKTGGAATEFLMADGSVTTGAFTGNIPDGQITFGNASSNGIISSANLEFDDTFKVLTVKGTSVGQTIVRDDNVLVNKDASTRIGIGISTIPRVQLSQGNVNTYLQLIGTPTQENTISLPDKSGTVALLDDVVGTVTGTGSAGFIPVWSSATGISASTMFELGTFIGIGTQTPGAQLETTANILVNSITIGAGIGADTVIIGQNALSGNGGAGNYNTAIGAEAMASQSGGFPQSNVAVGRQALQNIDDANSNAALGAYSMRSLSTGSNNTSVGSSSLSNNTTGDNNIAVGYNAGDLLSSNSPNFTPSNSIFIGNDTRAEGVGQTNQIVIGHEAIGLGSNTTVLGNATITKTRLHGNVGIGTDTPGYKLDVNGDARLSGAFYDSNNLPGTAGQILSSTGAQTSWVDPSAAITKLIPHFQLATPGGSAAYTQSNNIVDFDWSGGSGTYEYILPSATAIPYRTIRFVNNSTITASDKIHITAPSGETIDGVAFYEINKQYNGCAVWSDGVQWIVIQAKA